MSNITIGISDLNVARPPDILVTYALGSCVGICLYDAVARVAGLSHVLLPTSSQMPGNNTPMKFADTAIPMLMVKMQAMGARPNQLRAKIAGGAQMFAASQNACANSIASIVAAIKVCKLSKPASAFLLAAHLTNRLASAQKVSTAGASVAIFWLK